MSLMTPSTGTPSTCRDHPLVTRAVRIGGMGRLELLEEIQKNGIELNQAGLELFANDKFTTSESTSVLETVEITVADLGFAQGVTIARICERAVQLGCLCALLNLALISGFSILTSQKVTSGIRPRSIERHRVP